jgi:predicted nucleotidyltransferase
VRPPTGAGVSVATVRHVSKQWVPGRLQDTLAALVAACEEEPAVLAAWVGGSLARDTADNWSDIDLHLLVADPEKFAGGIADWFARTTPVVYAAGIPGVSGGFIFVTPDWLHVDVVVHGSQDFCQDGYPARVLLDPQARLCEIPASAEEMVGEPYLPEGQIPLFIYFMGVTVTVIHREEWLALAQGAASFRDSLLIPLMLAENSVRKTRRCEASQPLPHRGANRSDRSDPARRLRSRATGRGSRGHRTGVPHRARRLVALLGESWPGEFEQASLDLWRRELGIDLG